MYARGGEQLKTIHSWGPYVNGVQTENKKKIYIYLIIVITELIITIIINKKETSTRAHHGFPRVCRHNCQSV